jgi:aspartyl-tRNA(Asn)/glutamyl-tRNA(Gln) amidotransferase subunit A
MELQDITIEKAHDGLRKKEFSAVELTQAYLDRIENKDEKIHAFLNVCRKEALAQAAAIDKKIAAGEDIPPLAGIPVAVKDNILVEGTRTTAASKILEDYTAPYDATCIARLKEQGVVILGKTNLDEFAMGSSTENSAFGTTRNPHNLERVPGGSSGGSAAAVAGDLCVFSLGSDTGGSIRQPASFCGVVGLKPTYGAVSRYGLIAFASSLDQIGPLTKNVQDSRTVFDIIKGRDPEDSTSFEPDSLNSFKSKAVKDLIIGVPREYFVEGTDPAVIELVKAAIERYQKAGAAISEISLPHTDYALPCYYIIAPSEASANLARFDGIKYGFSKTGEAADLMEVYLKSRGEGFGPEVRRRIMLGTYALSSGYYEAYYVRSRKIKKLIEQDFNKAFERVDVIMSPVCPTTAFKVGERAEDPLQMYLSDIFTVSINLAGLPAVSLPCGEVDGLPVGLQIIGKHWDENRVFRTAEAFEKGEI